MLSRIRIVGRHYGKRGQSLVEFALVLPIVAALIMGVMDLGLVLYAHVQVAAAAGEGANVGSRYVLELKDTFDQADYDDQRLVAVRQAVLRSMGRLNTAAPNFVTTSDVIVSYPLFASSNPTRLATDMTVTPEEIQVRVKYRQQLFFGFLPNKVTISGKPYFEVTSSTRARIH